MKDVRMTVTDGAVCVFDGYKTVRFERECTAVRATDEVIFIGGDVVVRTGDVEPSDAARLYIEYLELLRSCPRYRTGDEVASQVKGNSEELIGKGLEMKPKKIKIRILEGEKVV